MLFNMDFETSRADNKEYASYADLLDPAWSLPYSRSTKELSPVIYNTFVVLFSRISRDSVFNTFLPIRDEINLCLALPPFEL